MTKLVRAGALSLATFAVAALVLSINPSVTAQGKKDDKKPAVKGTVEIYKDKKEQYRFKIVGADDKAIAMGTKGYEKKEECEKALATLKEILTHVKPTEVKGDDK